MNSVSQGALRDPGLWSATPSAWRRQTRRNLDDLPAFCAKLVEEFKDVIRAEQRA
jgi:hypothetical protein